MLSAALCSLFVLSASLLARDWSSIPAASFPAEAEKAALAGKPPAEAAAVLSAAAGREDIADGQLAAIVARVYASSGTTPLAVVRAIYPRVQASRRPRVAAALVAAAPACETRRITDVIRAVDHMPPPGIESTVRQVRFRAMGKE